jgi:hypothetical protein
MVPVICLVCALGACADIDKLREAQASFNIASTAETQSRLATYTAGGAVNAGDLSVQASTGYAKTISILKGLSDKETSQLKTDKLWGNAQAIEALSYWRLKDYRNATDVAKQIDAASLYPRDAAMIAALPGLVMISEANDDIYIWDPSDTVLTTDKKQCLFGGGAGGRKSFDAIDALLDSAIKTIDSGRGQVSRDDPVYNYLLQADLAAYKNKMDALANRCTAADFFGGGPQPVLPQKATLTPGELTAAGQRLGELYCSLQGKAKDPTVDPLVGFWSAIMGLPLPAPTSCVTK